MPGRLEVNTVNLEEIRAELTSDRERLIRRLENLGIDLKGGSKNFADDEGFADSGSVAAEKGELLTIAGTMRESLELVENALSRMDAGTYGKCASCGSDIPPGRLEIMPAATECLSCASARA